MRLCVFATCLPLLQLVPLPPSLWQQLAGREPAWQLIALSGLEGHWRPLSLDPGATVATALEVLPGLAMFLAMLRLPAQDCFRLIFVPISVGLLSALLGALQKSGGDLSPFILFPTPHEENSPGFFVNRNHQATFLLLSMLLTAGAARAYLARRPETRLITSLFVLGLGLVFAAGVVVTASRTGFLLLLPAIAASVLIMLPTRWGWKAASGAVLLVASLIALAWQSRAVRLTLQRFSAADDERSIYWSDTLRAIERSWPVGSGIGTFPKVHAAVQSVDSIGIQFVNNAHNDYLELALEGGAIAVALIGLGLVYMLMSGRRLYKARRHGGEAALGAAALAGIAIILLHSILDYPLRMLSIMALFGLLWALVIRATAAPSDGISERSRESS